MLSGCFATDASSHVFLSTPKPPPTPSGSLVLATGSAPDLVSIRLSLCILVWDVLVGVRVLGYLFLFVAALWVACVWKWKGCTTNNYASREKCKKCGQPKDVAAMPAIAMTGASLPSYSQYFASAQGRSERLVGNSALQQSLPLISNWSVGGAGVQPSSNWPLGGNLGAGLPYANPTNHTVSVPKEWRNGDWVSNCGFHNYLSRLECKNCNSSMPPALGTKRLASEEFAHLWDNKRLNSGHTNAPHQSYPGFEQNAGTIDAKPGVLLPTPI